MQTTKPIFFVSSGRSGSQMLHKLFSGCPQLEIHHEYLCTHVQPLAALWAMGRIEQSRVREQLSVLYQPAMLYSERPIWADSSNKLAWVIEILDEIFPNARYVHTVRDGRKVASSFFHKLGAECYDDRSVAILQDYLEASDRLPAPPPEKKYWWQIPQAPSPWAAAFRHFDQFERICYHWAEINRRIIDQLSTIPAERQLFCRLEDLTTDPDCIAKLCTFLDIPNEPGYFQALQRPHNISKPEDRLLTLEQTRSLMHIAGDMMDRFGYSQSQEYRMQYGQEVVASD
jgi:hypothetical protein